MKKRSAFLIAVAIPLLILLAMTVKPEVTVLLGQEVVLETKAVDPTDLFRGDYVSVSMKISDIPMAKLPTPIDKMIKKNLYVTLKQEGKYYVVDNVSVNKPKRGIYLKGKFQHYSIGAESVQLDYSLGKYFVKQGSGVDLQQQSAKGALEGKVKVLGGYGVLTDIKPKSI
ncbi:MAG: GDYXXLXY domain-containing protein [Desulfitobacteriaceae bacterium]